MDEGNKDFEIDILETSKVNIDKVQLPLNFVTIGQVQNDDIKIYIRNDVYKYIQKFSASDKTKEVGGILFGEYIEDLGKSHVVISAYIEAKYTDASSSTLTFTHETWEYIHSQHNKLFPYKKIVGWQHTHPSYGIFLSNYDFFIQENFFNMPWQLAYVVDPVNKSEGFFQWKNNKIMKVEGFYIYDEIGSKIELIAESPKVENKTAPRKIHIFTYSALVILAGLLMAALISRDNLKSVIKQSDDRYQAVEKQNQDLAVSVSGLKKDYDNLKDDLDKIQKSKDNSQNSDKSENITFEEYTVKKGDSLYKICFDRGLDFSNWKIIIRTINNLSNSDVIYEGQCILLPISKK